MCVSYRYVPNPAKALGNILAGGGPKPEVVEGEIVAGDPAELDVLASLFPNGFGNQFPIDKN